MNKEKKIKIFLGSAYILIVSIFLWFFFSKFSFQDFSSYELIRDNRDTLEQVKNSNIFISSIFFSFRNNYLGLIIRIWVPSFFGRGFYLW